MRRLGRRLGAVPDLAGGCGHVVEPRRCRHASRRSRRAWDTTAFADGLYDLRVVTTDNVGNTFTSPTIANVRVDNTAPTGSITAPAGERVRERHERRGLGELADAGSGVAYAPVPDLAARRRARGPISAQPTRRRPTASRGTRRRSPTASTTCASSRPTRPATPSPPRRHGRGAERRSDGDGGAAARRRRHRRPGRAGRPDRRHVLADAQGVDACARSGAATSPTRSSPRSAT